MNEPGTYLIQIAGEVEEGELNAPSPLHMRVVRSGTESSVLSVRTDQSGVIGLLRHLHGLGFAILSVGRER